LTQINIKNISHIDFKDNLYSTNKIFLDNILKTSNNICLSFGTNVRHESAILNTNIRYKYLLSGLNLLTMGYLSNNNIPNKLLTLNLENVFKIFEGFLEKIALKLIHSKHSLFLIGENFLNRISSLGNFIKTINKFLILPNTLVLRLEANAEGMNLFGNVMNKLNNKKNIDQSMSKFLDNSFMWNNHNEANFFINSEDNIFTRKLAYAKGKGKNFMLSTNTSGILKKSDVIFPITTIFEQNSVKQNSVYLTMTHLPQVIDYVVPQKGLEIDTASTLLINIFKKECVAISKNFYLQLPKMLPYFNYIYSTTNEYYFDELTKFDTFYGLNLIKNDINKFCVSKYPMKQEVKNFYENNYFCKNSPTLKKSSIHYKQNYTNFLQQ